ncbi:MAG TPA: tRNA 2-thiouridine(34) synthase MnmA [Burkholderiales bacterium]|nr:tRNA 2-thiouridine(34) synthase MnmA [Burkholderiales bacterium]
MARERIVVGMSGGVDSSVAALLLKRQGFDVVGLFMKNWEEDDDDEYCSTRQDLIDCASVAEIIGIDLEAVNFSAEYKERVFSTFLAEYSAGRTPNPDVLCNAEIKFKAFLDHAMALGAQRIATGHYARVRYVDAGVGENGARVRRVDAGVGENGARVSQTAGRYELLKAVDHSKDQSYFLHRLTQAQLARVMFPLGEMKKIEVRKIAEEAGLSNFAKRGSTGICFIGERPFREFLNRYLPRKPGPMRTPEGKAVGEHIGLSFYTIGQRKGVGIGGLKDSAGGPWYVCGKDLEKNELIVVQGHDHPLLLSLKLRADDLAWVSGEAPQARSSYGAKTRYRQAEALCRVSRVSGDDLVIEFSAPQWAVTPGQSAVLYSSEVCLGGGVIQ